MFSSFQSFTIVYWGLALIFFTLLIFEKKLVLLESKLYERIKAKRAEKRQEKLHRIAMERKLNLQQNSRSNQNCKRSYAAQAVRRTGNRCA